MKLHQFFEARQMKDPTKDSLVSKNGKVIVIDKSKEDDYLKKGWELAEAYPVYKTKDYIDRQDRNLKKTPKEKPKKKPKKQQKNKKKNKKKHPTLPGAFNNPPPPPPLD